MENRLPFSPSASLPASRKAEPRNGKVIAIASHPAWHPAEEPAGVADLMRTLRDALVQIQASPVLNMSDEHITVAWMTEHVHRRLDESGVPLRLSHLLLQTRSERSVLCLQLALLELLRMRTIQLRSDRHCAEILLTRKPATA